MPSQPPGSPDYRAYIVAARRSAIGRVGGLHRTRRIESLTAPIVSAVLEDCGLAPARVDEIIIGNATAGGNPARLIALSAGLPETVPATTVDRQCGSGLDAILNAIRIVGVGEAQVVVAGGAESLSTAPWRIARPKSLYQTPHFIGADPGLSDPGAGEPHIYLSSEDLASRLGISRAQQDAYAFKSHLRAQAAREARRFVGEIVPLRGSPEEARDQSAADHELEDFEQLQPLLNEDGTLTAGNSSALHDGAAIVVVVSEAVWQEMGKPPALRLVASAVQGVSPSADAIAPVAAINKLYDRLKGFNTKDIGVVEMSETSAAQAIALLAELGYDEDMLNPDGGAVVRGHPFGAAGSVLVVRLFSRMVRDAAPGRPKFGVATLGTVGGMGLAALFEAV